MGKASLRNLLAHKGRLVLSLLAVVLSAGFVSGTLIFTDTLQKSFEDLFAQTASDVVVSPLDSDGPSSDGSDGSAVQTPTVPSSILATVQSTEGIAAAAGDVFAIGATIIGSDGEPVTSAGGPSFGLNWIDDPRLTALTMVEGTPPVGESQMAIDSTSAEKGALKVGDRTTVVTPQGVKDVTVVGIFKFGVSGSLNGATLAAFETPVAQELMLDGSPNYTSISAAAAEGFTQDQAAANVMAAIGSGFKVQTGQENADETAQDLKSQLSFFNYVLLAFAFVSVIVGLFLIFNTFAMLVAQRTRELALFRALGASKGQVRSSVLLEASVVGVIGAALGLLGGMALAAGLRALFGLAGLDFSGSLVVAPRTVIVAVLVGLGATLAASVIPAFRAAKAPPVAALRDDLVPSHRSLRIRTIVGVAAAALTALVLVAGLSADKVSTGISLVGLSFVLAIGAAIVVAPAITGPVVRVLGWPFRSTIGRIAVGNVQRNRRRTALTAAALMIGLALVGAFSTLAVSFGDSIDSAIDDSVKADFVVSNSSFLPMPAQVGDDLQAVPGVETVARIRFAPVASFGSNGTVTGVDAATINEVTTLPMESGEPDLSTPNSVLIDTTIATDQGLAVGDSVALTFANGDTKDFVVTGIYKPEGFFSGLVVSNDALVAVGTPALDTFLYVRTAPGADAAAIRPAVDAAVANNPTVTVQDLTELKDSIRTQINGLLIGIYALLALVLFIAVLGIVNTLALSVVERTREIGLLRAVGTSRRQMRQMIRVESLITSVFGAIVGMLIGIFFGQMLVRSLNDVGLTAVSTPWTSLVVFLALSALVGVLAAAWPARRAARMDVLQAIATE